MSRDHDDSKAIAKLNALANKMAEKLAAAREDPMPWETTDAEVDRSLKASPERWDTGMSASEASRVHGKQTTRGAVWPSQPPGAPALHRGTVHDSQADHYARAQQAQARAALEAQARQIAADQRTHAQRVQAEADQMRARVERDAEQMRQRAQDRHDDRWR